MTTLKTIRTYFDNMEIQTEEERAMSEIITDEIEKRKKVGKLLDLAIKNCEQDGDRYTLELLEQLKEII
jgi:DNA-binding ferritin-like protein